MSDNKENDEYYLGELFQECQDQIDQRLFLEDLFSDDQVQCLNGQFEKHLDDQEEYDSDDQEIASSMDEMPRTIPCGQPRTRKISECVSEGMENLRPLELDDLRRFQQNGTK